MKNILLSFFILFAAMALKAQPVKYVVKLKDKSGTPYSLSNPSAYLSSKAIARRNRQHISIDSTDLPVSPAYVAALQSIAGVTILNTSRWFNEVFVRLSGASVVTDIELLPFVISSQPMSGPGKPKVVNKKQLGEELRSKPESYAKVIELDATNTVVADSDFYGMNFPQVHIHEGEFLHNNGYRGEGMTIAMLDAGFYQYNINPALDSMRLAGQVIAEHDFVNGETSVAEDDLHGANCLTILAANRPGFIVGTAPKAGYLLFRTEEAATETPAEEQNWIVGAEMADSAGADMISSSLGYVNFDNPAYNHTYAGRNGNTYEITIAADMAAKKGMIVMNSAGNSGLAVDDTKFISCPADGDSVMTVGSVDKDGLVTASSSWGPSSSGRTKPNIVSVGRNAVFALPSGEPAVGSGTSYSNPNVAGLILCLWQAFPEFSNMEILKAVEQSSNRYEQPDNRYGYGIPNFRRAFGMLVQKRILASGNRLSHEWLGAYPVPFKSQFNLLLKAPKTGPAGVRMVDISGKVISVKNLQVIKDNFYYIPMSTPKLKSGVYVVVYWDGANKRTLKIVRE